MFAPYTPRPRQHTCGRAVESASCIAPGAGGVRSDSSARRPRLRLYLPASFSNLTRASAQSAMRMKASFHCASCTQHSLPHAVLCSCRQNHCSGKEHSSLILVPQNQKKKPFGLSKPTSMYLACALQRIVLRSSSINLWASAAAAARQWHEQTKRLHALHGSLLLGACSTHPTTLPVTGWCDVVAG